MLLTYQDLQPALNIDLTDPNGQELADSLIEAAQALFSGPLFLNFPIEQSEVNEYHNGGVQQYWLNTTAPVSDLVAASRDRSTNTYDTFANTAVINHGDRNVHLTTYVSEAFHALRFTYSTGWTADTLPKDLRQAIIDTVAVKLLEVANYSGSAPGAASDAEGEDENPSTPTGTLKKVVSIGYTEEYSTAEADAYWKAKTAQLTRTIGDNLPQPVIDTVIAYRPSYAL
jgi:hypothetical protein